MFRLSDRAYTALADEARRLTENDPLKKTQGDILLKRLMRLRDQKGSPVTEAELQSATKDLLPNFSDRLIKQAVQWSQPPGPWQKLLWGSAIATGLLGGLAGLIWVVNLPYPMIRRPVAERAPLLLLPSFWEMDHHYRQTISLVEQADQLVNQATGPADIRLGKTKVTAAQKSLDKLPVWFLGYSPQFYCRWFSCTWYFTLDEFEGARKAIGRLSAKVFQEEQALQKFHESEEFVTEAKAWYQKDRQPAAIDEWQAAMDNLEELPEGTLASRLAQTKLKAYKRDFMTIVSDRSGEKRTSTMLDAAKQYALAASQAAQNPPHPTEVWLKIERQWEDAISQLGRIPAEDPGYVEAQKLKATYQNNLGTIQIRRKQEEASAQALKQAQDQYANLVGQGIGGNEADRNRSLANLQRLINTLQEINAGTTAYPKAQNLLKTTQQLVKQVQ